MKGLIHSKKFRQNLFNWLFVYVGVLGLLASVVTYSKYISSLGTKDEARVTKFNVKIEFAEECSNNSATTICNMGNYLPFEKMYYYFKVDTREIETAANIYLTASVQGIDASKYKITSIDEVISSGEEVTYNPILKDEESSENKKYQTTKLDVKKDIRTYRATVEYIPGQIVGENTTSSYELYIGYSASQVYGSTLATPDKSNI